MYPMNCVPPSRPPRCWAARSTRWWSSALTDPLPIKRIAAAETLVRDKDSLPTIRKMMQDANPQVRLRVAMALVINKEKDAVPVIVDSLAVLNPDQLWQAEELLDPPGRQ